MSLDGNEWELSKENVQPLRQGRVMATLQEVLAQQDVSTHPAIQQQKREFESEIRFYCGDDPLDVWDRYIKWTEQTFPQGGKESNLSVVLERAVKALNEQQRYYQDPRYLSLWLKFGSCCSEPLDLYSYLHSQKIGTSLAQLYITWAEELEERGNYKKADLIFQDGLLCKAAPLDKLLSHHRQFQARVSRQILQDLDEDHDGEEELGAFASEPQRATLAELKGRGKKMVKAPVSRVGNAVKLPSQGQRLQNSSQQASNHPSFAVFDENKVVAAPRAELPALVPQPWVAPPAVKAKENELQAGPWNIGRHPRSNLDSGTVTPAFVPSFTPYVEESAQQQTMTPCKIESSINSVLSARKPGKEEDPLHRVQSHQQDGQEKKEQPMYCKEKVYAGVEEFSLEEIRAETYRKKAKKRREEELQTIAQKKAELQRKIEEMEKIVREQQENDKQRSCAQQEEEQEPVRVPSDTAEALKPSLTERQLSLTDNEAFEGHCSDCFSLKSNLELDENVQHKKSSSSDSEIPPAVNPPMTFSIFVEASTLENESTSLSTGPPVLHARRPLAVRTPSESIAAQENIPPENSGELNGIEPLSEDAIVTGSYKNKTLCPNPEDTCVFARAAHLASTPFHGITEQRKQLDDKSKEECPEPKPTSLSQQTIVSEDQYADALFVKKLSPIMEASQEDTRSSASSGSPTQISTIKFQQIPEKLELVHTSTDEIAGDVANGSNYSPEGLWKAAQQRRQLLQPLPDLLTKSPDFKLEAQPMPWMELGKEVHIGNYVCCVTREYLISEGDKMFFAVPANIAHEVSTAFLIKVHSEPLPWDFYILLQLQDRLDTGFDQSFSEKCSCFLYHNGCVILHKEINCFTVQDMIQHCKVIPQEVVVLIVDNLLEVVEKLHKVKIVHGNLHPGTLFLGDRICKSFAIAETTSALKIVDFSHSFDLQLQPAMNSLKSFPIAQSQSGQQILDEKSLPYQVDLLGIADIIHKLLFREPMQVYQEKGYWKTRKDLSQSVDSDLWSKLFERTLNANGNSTVSLLRELREELNSMFDSSFPERLSDSLTKLEDFLSVENVFRPREIPFVISPGFSAPFSTSPPKQVRVHLDPSRL
ncbi:mitotic checkpoint serine/threonine-protein kinase BUB1 beta [Rhineura floridana]|uniref:mitotic checkpoint serine/threonine-protein kinase BUB1 beta n=1 Tax=Rhineura floridana TaxID=261503 RepID=UPI002AC8388E|nr:mitotic checkpoint serine/threonine-protein kinase BUB1 beta [Rhineura floridana]XP_061467443.1 mitotic checkpoint serine/threonine-protein kinase BUB1 beta [Rhineura floridana]